MLSARLTRLPLGALLVAGVLGCNTLASTQEQETTASRQISTSTYKYRDSNQGRVVGTIDANKATLDWAGVKSLEGSVAQAFDPDGTPLGAKVTVDKDGHFLITDLRTSRPRIFVEADVNGLRFRATMTAPRTHKDYTVVLDAGTTYLADKLRRAALDHDVPFDKLDTILLGETETVVNTYMQDGQRRDVLEQNNPDLNAYSFDHFMDENSPVKLAVYQLSPAVLRGWTPPPVLPVAQPTPTDAPTSTPTTQPTPTPEPSGTPPK
ncbi:MAG: hypothetical protein JWM80_3425 [Cyanobacteria bacterium RYN_339]|nr:hypothetical protein [Cyanobacteria bacterium RYN_339]